MKVNNNESPANFGFGGNIGSMIQAATNRAPGQSQTAAMLGGSLSGHAKALFNANQGIANGNGKGVEVLSGAADAVPGSSGDISELSDRVSALEQGGANAPTGVQGALAESTNAVFPNSAQNAAQGMFGSTDQRQNSVNPILKKMQ